MFALTKLRQAVGSLAANVAALAGTVGTIDDGLRQRAGLEGEFARGGRPQTERAVAVRVDLPPMIGPLKETMSPARGASGFRVVPGPEPARIRTSSAAQSVPPSSRAPRPVIAEGWSRSGFRRN
jgi:hypothetical protein